MKRNQILKAVTALSFSLLAACSQPMNQNVVNAGPSTAIVNGEAVEAADLVSRSTVALYLITPNSEKMRLFCSGTIIGSDTVLSAAHCLVDVALYLDTTVEELIPRLRVGFGLMVVSNEQDDKIQLISLKSAIVHPEYKMDSLEDAANGKALYDVSLLKLEKAIPANFKAAELLSQTDLLKVGLNLQLAGYGLTRPGAFPEQAKQLMKTTVTVDNVALNPTQFTYHVTNGQGACMGDSGGPAYMTNAKNELVVAGVTSWGDGNCHDIGVYTSVAAVFPWIQESLIRLSEVH